MPFQHFNPFVSQKHLELHLYVIFMNKSLHLCSISCYFYASVTSSLLFSVTIIFSLFLFTLFLFVSFQLLYFISLLFIPYYVFSGVPSPCSFQFHLHFCTFFPSTSFLSCASRCLLLPAHVSHKLVQFCFELLLHSFLFLILQNILLQSYLWHFSSV